MKPHPKILFLPFVLLVGLAEAAKLPRQFPRCKKSDPHIERCLSEAITKAVSSMTKSVPSLRLPTLDPLIVDKIEFPQRNGPISIMQTLENVSLTGLENILVKNVNFLPETPELTMFIDLSGIIRANYNMIGSVLGLPIRGQGPLTFRFYGVDEIVSLLGHKTVKNGKTYFAVEKVYIDVHDMKRMEVQYGNLFDGDPEAANAMNKLLNDNWRVLWDELRPTFQETFAFILLQYAKNVFDNVPFDDIFLD